MKPTSNNDVPRDGLEALPTVSDAMKKMAEAMDLFSEAFSAFVDLWEDSLVAQKIRAARIQMELANNTEVSRTVLNDAIEVWTLPDDPLREELEALDRPIPHILSTEELDAIEDEDERWAKIDSQDTI
jgi:hypothetical protein